MLALVAAVLPSAHTADVTASDSTMTFATASKVSSNTSYELIALSAASRTRPSSARRRPRTASFPPRRETSGPRSGRAAPHRRPAHRSGPSRATRSRDGAGAEVRVELRVADRQRDVAGELAGKVGPHQVARPPWDGQGRRARRDDRSRRPRGYGWSWRLPVSGSSWVR